MGCMAAVNTGGEDAREGECKGLGFFILQVDFSEPWVMREELGTYKDSMTVILDAMDG